MDELSPKRVRFFENCYYFESLSWNSAAFRLVSMVVKNNNNWSKQAIMIIVYLFTNIIQDKSTSRIDM